jgi:hypothetical protein
MPFLLGLKGKGQVTAVGLGFSGKSGLQKLFGL